MIYYIPEYVHVYEVNQDYIAIFNALSLDIVYCQRRLVVLENSQTIIDPSIKNIILDNEMVTVSEKQAVQKIELNIKKYNLNKNKINFLYIVPTVSCNLHCTYCHIQHGKECRKSCVMTEKTLKNGLEIFKKYGGFEENESEIMFYGGEPFLEIAFVIKALEIIRSYSQTVKITFFTNGTLITEEIANCLREYNVYVIVSIDGSKNAHDAARIYHDGSGSFEDSSRGYKRLQEKGVAVGISLVAGTHNINSLEDEVEYLVEKYKPLDIGISTLHLFKDAKNPNEVEMEELTKKLQVVQKNMRNQGFYIEHLFRRIRPFVEKKIRLYDCPSCNSKLLITPWDTIGFCEAFMEEENYFYPTEQFDLFKCDGRRDWQWRTPLIMKECYSCPAISICGGGCPYDAYCESGNICNKDKRRCYQSKEMIKWLCIDLFYVLQENHKIKGQNVFIPTEEERKLLYGNIILDESIPLQRYSKMNESEG